MPKTVLDVAEIRHRPQCRVVATGAGVDEIGVIVGDIAQVAGVVIGVELDADAILDPHHPHSAAQVAERLVAQGIVVEHEADAVRAIGVVADVDVEGQP